MLAGSVLIIATLALMGTSAQFPRILFFDEYEAPSMCEYTNKKGWACEQHRVISDGYILVVDRIIGPGKNSISKNTTSGKKPPVILIHGLGFSSANFVLGRPENALGLILANEGFDIWMPNTRGNIYCRKHMTKNPMYSDFWDFGQDEIATVDVPNIIDYVLEKTGFDKVGIVGLSLGGTTLYQTFSARPEYNSKVYLMVVLSGPTDRLHDNSPISLAEPPFWVADSFVKLMIDLGLVSIQLPFPEIMPLFNTLYTWNKYTKTLGTVSAGVSLGFDLDQFDYDKFAEGLLYIYPSLSWRTIIQYIQMRQRISFAKYDFGPAENLRRYNSTIPPVYDLRKITAPVALFWSLNDWSTPVKDIQIKSEQLPNLVGAFQIEWPLFTHLDLIYSLKAGELLFSRVTKLMIQYSGIDT